MLWMITFPPQVTSFVAERPYTVNCGVDNGRGWAIVTRRLRGAFLVDDGSTPPGLLLTAIKNGAIFLESADRLSEMPAIGEVA